MTTPTPTKTDPLGRKLGTIESVMAESLVSHRTFLPMVNLVLTVEGEQHAHSIAIADALEISRNIAGAAEAAISDAFLMDFLSKKIGVPRERSWPLIAEFRDYRTQLNSMKKGE